MRAKLLGAGLALALLSACSSTGTTGSTSASATVSNAVAKANAAVPTAYKLGCGAVSVADGYFKAAAPALLASGKLTQADMAKETSIMVAANARCATPPADLAQAGADMLADASAIYLMIAVQPPAATPAKS